MDVTRWVCIALASIGFSAATAHAQSSGQLAVQAAQKPGPVKPWKQVTGLGRVLDLSKPPVVIDEPGLYALQRDWDLTGYELGGDIIRITANNVTLDLHGFGIGIRLDNINSTLLAVSGNQVVVRNGQLEACCEGAATFGSTGFGTRLEHLDVNGQDPMRFEGTGATITDSVIHARWGINVNETSVVRGNLLSCRTFCLTLQGAMNQVIDNRFNYADADVVVQVDGDGNVIERNVMDGDVFGPGRAYSVDGDRNVLRDNTITGSGFGTVFAVSGTGNTLDGNIVASREGGLIASVGIRFTADGNYYGDNRMAAQVPFALGATVQADWGGNVGYGP
jgi:hypothetical protein